MVRAAASGARARYGAVFRLPHARALLLAEIPARAPITILGLATVLFVREHAGSYALAGLCAGAVALAFAIAAPLVGRLIDRVGLVAVVLPCTALHTAAVAGFVACGLLGGPSALLVATGALLGATLPPVGSITRALWPRIIDEGGGDPDLLSTALAVEGVMIETLFTVGPLIAAAITVLTDPAYAVAAAPVLLICGLLLFLPLHPVRTWRTAEPEHDHGRLGALRSRGLRALMLCILPLGFCFGAVEVTLPAFAEDHGNRVLGGVLIGAWSLGSALGGLLYGAVDWQTPVARRYALLSSLVPVAFAPLAAAPSIGAMAALAWLAGLSVAPVLTAGNQVVGDLAERGTETEAYTWPITALVTGVAAGNAVAGALVTHGGVRQALVVAAAGAAVACALAWSRWPAMQRPA